MTAPRGSPKQDRPARNPAPKPASGQKVLTTLPRGLARPAAQSAPFAPACAMFRRHLREQGLRFTPERAMVLDVVLRQEGLFDAEQIVEQLKSEGHRGSRATVYRTLSHLQEAGILKQVFFDASQSYYELILGGQTHDYLVSVETGRVIEFSSEEVGELVKRICAEHGLEAVSHQLQIFASRPGGAGANDARDRPGEEPVDD